MKAEFQKAYFGLCSKTFSKVFSLIFITTMFFACNSDELVQEPPPFDSFEYLTFGHFYGFCQGEACIEIFRIDSADIYEDTLDNYPNGALYEGSFQVLDRSLLTRIRDIAGAMSNDLLSYSNTTIGCPDCADQGGLYLELSMDISGRQYWIFDQNKDAVPEEFHALMDAINESITIIND